MFLTYVSDQGRVPQLCLRYFKGGMKWILMLNLWHMEPAMFSWYVEGNEVQRALWPSVFLT